ncbi:MAG: hypothetical protein PWP47_680 [Synergistaceae bacterium]|nr:hypothetical protein [Synergistaceae bacterium]
MADFDPVIMIRNARIVDGSGTPWRKGLVRTGMDAVLVLFNPAVKNGVFTGTTAGKVLRRS